jgi:two-component sensor histidine kinase
MVDDGNALRLVWTETGGTDVTAPETESFGLTFVSRSVEHELRGACSHEFRTEGYRCTLVLPGESVLGRLED